MASTNIRLTQDTTAYQGSNAAKNYAGAATLTVRNQTNLIAYSYILTRGLPSGSGLVVTSAFLRLTPTATYASTTVDLSLVDQTWTSTKVTYSKKPTAPTVIGTYTGTLTKNVAIDIPITAATQGWISGTPNYGVRVSSTATSSRVFHSGNATGSNAKFAPQLIVNYSLQPAVPTSFTLTGNRKASVVRPTTTWAYLNPDGTGMASYQIQTNPSDIWTSPTTSSAELPSTSPTHMWTSDIAVGTTLWYRIRHKSTAGRWSEWSSGQQFGREAKPTVTVTGPAAAATSDPTPTTVWTVTGGTQTLWCVTIKVAATGAELTTSGWRSGTALSWAPTDPLNVATGVGLVSVVDVIDTVDRIATPGDPLHATASSGTFSLGTGSGVTAISSLAVAPASVAPASVLTWTRPTVPDQFVVERTVDGTTIRAFVIESASALVSGTNYRWTDATIPPRHSASYVVRAVENGAMSAPSSAVVISTDPQFIYLIDADDSTFVMPVADGTASDFAWEEDSAVFNVLGSDRTMVVAEGTGRLNGAVTGGLFADALPWTGGATARQMRERAYRLRREPTKEWRLVVDTWNLPVVVRDVQIQPTSGPNETFGVSFNWYAQGELPQDTNY